MRQALNSVVAGRGLDVATARAVMDRMMEGEASPVQIAALIAALRTKGETVDELAGMVESMRAHATPMTLPVAAVDTCGTGGDGAWTFNIWTAAALVAAGAGCPVAKHGNRAASSRCGSADVLESLGVVISLSPAGVRRRQHVHRRDRLDGSMRAPSWDQFAAARRLSMNGRRFD